MQINFKKTHDFKILMKFLHRLYFVENFHGKVEISSRAGMDHHVKPIPSYRTEDIEKSVKDYDMNLMEDIV